MFPFYLDCGKIVVCKSPGTIQAKLFSDFFMKGTQFMKRGITYGTFDLFHQGHYNILKRARELGDYLVVGVTSESYDIERGKLNVQDSLLKRIENVRKTGFADEIIVEEYQGQKLNDITKYNIDLLVVGSDWRGKFDYLKNYCEVVYLERTKNISSTKLRSCLLYTSPSPRDTR